MHKTCYYILLIFIVTIGVTLGNNLTSVAENYNEETELSSRDQKNNELDREMTVVGNIDNISDTEIIIDDSLFRFAPRSGLGNNSFSKGQRVYGELDDIGRIVSLERYGNIENERVSVAKDRIKSGDTDTAIDGSAAVFLEDGVWKN